ncbi:MAG: UDP-glucose dehydrogenase family protein, partial [Bdellovibrio sp.]
MKISVFGTGYVGLVTGVCFAEMGNQVICADVDQKKINKLKDGISPIYEPGLDDLVTNNIKAKRITFTTDLKHAVEESDVVFIAVGTPSDVDGSADLKYVLQVAETIGTHLNGYKVVINKSTVPVGTQKLVKDKIAEVLKYRAAKIDYDVVSNPEFLREGCAIEDALKPNRVVVGCESDKAADVMRRLYEPFLKSGNPLLVMDPLSSEMTKYAANSMLATKISLMNEFSRVCEKVGADIEQVRRGIGTDFRIGPHFIFAGVGYGGSCFPKDVKALIKAGSNA